MQEDFGVTPPNGTGSWNNRGDASLHDTANAEGGHWVGWLVFSGRMARLESVWASIYDPGETTPTPTPPGREGQKKSAALTQGVGSKTRLCPGLLAHRPFRTSVCAGAWVWKCRRILELRRLTVLEIGTTEE